MLFLNSCNCLKGCQLSKVAAILISIFLSVPTTSQKNPTAHHHQLILIASSGWFEQLRERAFKRFLEGANAGFTPPLSAVTA